MRKSKTDHVRIPSPFDATATKTERSAVAVLMHWMRQIIEKENIDLGLPDVDTSGADRKSPDTVICESRRSQNILCVIEAKPPYYDVFDENELKEPAKKKANQRKAKYFAVTNFKWLIWFNTEKANALKAEEDQIVERYSLSQLENLDDIEQTRYCEPIQKGLEDFLAKLYVVSTGKESEPKLAIDEFLIFRLHEKIRVLSTYYKSIIDDKCHKDSSFAKELKGWFVEQGWDFAWQPQDFDKAARQTAYLLVNKILFYNLLQAKRPRELEPLEIPESLYKGESLKLELQKYFSQVLKIDYETIYTADFIDRIAFPDAKEVIKEIKELVNVLKRYDFSKLGYDVIGRIFERLIPQDERHNLGQYFTNADVVDLILKFCLQHEDDKILDPACGAGTFLVRAYQHKKLMNQRKGHEDILNTLWGNDIAKFPAHLATINLSVNDLGVDKNYPNILQEDFFALLVGAEGFDPEKWRRARARTLGLNEREVIYPRWFDVLVGNPPYTRQEEIPEIGVDKEKLIENALSINNNRIAEIGKRAGIHAYFFVHGTKFLKDSGRFGFIVSNSWLDVDYGKGLQEFFLKNYKIIAVIESKVERWFEEADINTCIIILQKCKDKKERDKNLVRFVYLKKPLRHFIPPAQDMWEKQIERLNAIDQLKKTILAHNDFYENDEMRIYPESQKELWEEGFAAGENEYIGAKWGKYLRAPEIFFKILKKGKGKLVPLKEIAQVRRGFTTGANEFFYLTEEEIKKKGIEKTFWMHKDEKGKLVPNKVIVSPKEGRNVVLNVRNLKNIVLVVNKEKSELKHKNVLAYIKQGETKGLHKRATCKSRKMWYSLEIRSAWPILHPMIHHDRQTVLSNKHGAQVDHNLFEIKPKRKRDVLPLLCFLLSTVSMLIKEFLGRVNLGEGALKTEGIDIERLLVPREFSREAKWRLHKLAKKHPDPQVNSIFDDLHAEKATEVSLDKVTTDRRELDKIIMGEILGLTDEEQLEVYRAVVDLVKSRIDKAKSFGKKKKMKEGLDVDAFVKIVKEKIGEQTLGKFYREKILAQKSLSTKSLPKFSHEIKIERQLFGWKLFSGKHYAECRSEEEARYLKVFLEAGLDKVKMPKDESQIKVVLPDLEKLKKKIDEVINSYLESIVNAKTREQLKHLLWQEALK
jgi:type I restriction-modification system DNA methylase subunit